MSGEGEIVGMVDVLKLTYATLDQINSMSTGDSEGPAWNKFWMSIEHDTESMLSGEGSAHHSRHPESRSHVMSPDMSRPGVERLDSVAPNDSASHAGVESPAGSAVAASTRSPTDAPFPFKFKAPSGRTHRLTVAPAGGLPALISIVADKLGPEASQLGGVPTFEESTNAISSSGFALSYLDNEGDTVSITTDADLIDAIALARSNRRDKVDLFVHHPEKPPLPATLNPMPTPAIAVPTPPESVKDRRSFGLASEEETDTEDATQRSGVRNRKKSKAVPSETSHGVGQKQEQVIQGVPNELLLPGAIVTLAVVIIGVFAFTRPSNR